MARKQKRSRIWVTLFMVALIAVAVAFAFWPRPIMIDQGVVKQEQMIVTVNEEGKTRVRDAYVVSTPIAGRLLRAEVDPGDAVKSGETIIARMLPTNPAALDIRTQEQAEASIHAAEAALRVARADLNKAMADKDLADHDMERTQKLFESGTASQAAMERAERAWRAAGASLDMTLAAISMREANLANAQAQSNAFVQNSLPFTDSAVISQALTMTAPVTGRILRVIQESETILAAGTPILEIGDISNDLEIVAELLSTDAVKVAEGNRVIIDNWGGSPPLNGIVERVDPWGFTKFSALGVEEQRVNVVISFTDPAENRESLGHGFRVEVQIVVWEEENVLTVPSSAIFREGKTWSVFTVADGTAHLTPITVGRNNGLQAQILSGLEETTQVILYPSANLSDGSLVAQRSEN